LKSKKMKPINSPDGDYALVYSTEPLPEAAVAERCPTCSQPSAKCSCPIPALRTIKPTIHLERKGRAGKMVTLLRKLPAQENLLRKLCAELKRTLGTGGTYYVEGGEGVVEIQGSREAAVSNFLKAIS
jgi:translation initiation factor 1 (eIF-1/SUI1)